MTYYVGSMPVGEDELYHYGIKGMRWGRRNYQNRDGSLTAAGRQRYGVKQRVRNVYNRGVKASKSYWGSPKKRKATAKKVARAAAIGAGTVGLAYLGYRNRAALRSAGRAFSNVARKTGRNASAKLAQSRRTREIRNSVADVRRNLNRSAKAAYKERGIVNNKFLRKGDKFIVDVGNKARKTGQGVKNTAHNVKVKASVASQKAKLGRAQAKIYKQTGIVGNQMGKGRKFMADASMKASKTAKSVKNAPKKAVNAVNRKKDIRNVRKAGEEMDFLRRRSAARKAGKDLAKGSTADYIRLKGRRVTSKVGGAAKKAGTKARGVAETAKRRRRISKQVSGAFNSPSRYVGTHTPKQAGRDVARAIGTRAAATVAGSVGGAYIGNRIERKYSGTSTKKRRKKSRK